MEWSQRHFGHIEHRVDTGANVRRSTHLVETAALRPHARYARSASYKLVGGKALLEAMADESVAVLLLDLRDEQAFAECHIAGAQCYPARILSRSTNAFSADILAASNKTDKIIVLVDEDERTAGPAADNFFQKGVDNAVVLRGGLNMFAQHYPERLEVAPGQSLERLFPNIGAAAGLKGGRPGAGSRPGTAGTRPGTAGSRRGGRPGSPPRAMHVYGPASVAQRPNGSTAATLQRYGPRPDAYLAGAPFYP